MVVLKTLEKLPDSCAKCPFIAVNRYLRSEYFSSPVPWWECKLTGGRSLQNINKGRMSECPLKEVKRHG